jgi:hypothetical protein
LNSDLQLLTSLETFCADILNVRVAGEHSPALCDFLESRARGDKEQLEIALKSLHTVLTVRAGGDWIKKGQQHDASEALSMLLQKMQRENVGSFDAVGYHFQDQSGSVCSK